MSQFNIFPAFIQDSALRDFLRLTSNPIFDIKNLRSEYDSFFVSCKKRHYEALLKLKVVVLSSRNAISSISVIMNDIALLFASPALR